jgi:hypothetical protein
MDLIAAFGLLFCRIIVATGFRALAPSACFGGDTSTIGWEALVVLVLAIVGGSAVGYRAAGSSSVVMIVVALSVLAAGSAAIVHYVS